MRDHHGLIVGRNEDVLLRGEEGVEHLVVAKVDTGAYSTSIDTKLAELFTTQFVKNKYVKSSNGHREERAIRNFMITIQGVTYTTEASITDRAGMKYPMLIGRRLLKEENILVDVSRTYTGAYPVPKELDDRFSKIAKYRNT